ncbi:MAG: hypothetical protein ACK4XJ_11695 [Fimbriimonadaceae bacterium]
MLHPSALLTRLAFAAAFGALLVGPAIAQNTSVRVTHHATFTQAKSLLAKLSAETGVRLEVAASMANEPIFLAVTDVPLAELMNRIAAATNGEWERAGEGYRLNRGTALTQKLRAQELAARAEMIKAALDRYLTTYRSTEVLDEASAKKSVEEQMKRRAEIAQQLQQQHNSRGDGVATQVRSSFTDSRMPAGPSRLAFELLMQTLRADELAKIEPGERVVFSSNPTRMQRAAIFDANRVASEYVRLNNIVANAARQVRATEDVSTNIQIQMPGSVNPDAKPLTRIGKVLLVVTRRSHDPVLNLELRVFGTDGSMIDQYASALMLQPQGSGSAKVASEPKFEFSPLSRELLTLLTGQSPNTGGAFGAVTIQTIAGGGSPTMVFSSSGGPVTAPKISDALLERLTKPEEFDPLSFYVADAFYALAKSSKKNVVASVPDSLFSVVAAGMARTNLDPETFSAESGFFGTKAQSDEAWLVVSAAEPWTAQQARIPREALGRTLRTALQKKYLTLDDLGTFASQLSAYRESNGVDQRYMDLVVPNSGMKYRTVMAQSLSALKLFSSLNLMQRNELGRSGRIPAASMSPAQIALLNQMVFGAESSGIMFTLGDMGGGGGGTVMSVAAEIAVSGGGRAPAISLNNYLSERTEAMPNGIPREATFQLSANASEGVLMMRPGDRDGAFQNPFGLFMSTRMGDESKAAVESGEFRLATVTDYRLSLSVGDQMLETRHLTDGQVLATSGTYRFGSLPESIKNAMSEAERQTGNVRIPPPVIRSGGGG